MSARVAIERVSAGYGGDPVLKELSLQVEHGEWLGLLGPNGSGKTTLLRSIARLVPHTGTVSIGGVPTAGMSRSQLARCVAVVPQDPLLPAGMTVADYVLLGRTAHRGSLGRGNRRDFEVANAAIARLDLAGFERRRLGTLSGGEAQRVVLSRALVQEPSVLLLDEPTSALDIGHQQAALELVDELRRERGITVIAAMHDLTLAGQYADRVALLSQGLLVASGTPEHVLTPDLIVEHYDATIALVDGPDGRTIVVPHRGRAGRDARVESEHR